MQLSKRLSAVAGLVTPGNRLVDVGTDHGYIPIYLVSEKIVPGAIAMDINRGPLERAKEHISENHLEDHIETRLSDGVSALKAGEADSLIIAGMGGGLVVRIMSEGREVLSGLKEFILQPQSEIETVRRFLQDSGYLITEEDMVLEDGKFYPVMKAVHGTMDYESRIFFKFGRHLLEDKNPVLKKYLEKEYLACLKIREALNARRTENTARRLQEIEEEIKDILEAKKYFD